ncbi:cyclic nucleotide-binding domain-containing protein [Bacteriovorax stolpii]|uniref:Uncharacterized protein n=2 Tax=Bacteriovorax stolpii TaxID=960 RepID=A0A2K9NRP0_BACTC|nr:hypothetical protein C0V70_06440 [Bacteriovorax stolpii]QDK42260.1 cyclic nucleotide-binding domain-containing protein [Bacteriovorax stolpii]TDP51575.1 hypothetical protein C8D79_3019 [Bacteriovorax stolpii]
MYDVLMKFLKHIELSRDLIEKITAYFPTKVYKSHSHLFYEGQIPISGYLVLDGSIQISKKKKFKKMLQSGSLIGVAELMNKVPSPISAEVFPNTQVCFLDKSTLIEIYQKADSDIVNLLKQIVET